MATEATKISLWLMPSAEYSEKAAKVIRRASAVAGEAPFEPHVTLLGGLEWKDEEEAKERAKEVVRDGLASENGPLFWGTELQPKEIAESGSWNKCVFLRLNATGPLLTARRECRKALEGVENDPEYDPHLSLAYGELSSDQRERVREEAVAAAHEEGLLSEQLPVRSVALYRTCPEGPAAAPSWQLLSKFPLGFDFPH